MVVQVLALLFLVVLPVYHLMSWFAIDGWLQTRLAHRGVQVPVDEIARSNRTFAFLVQTVPLVSVIVTAGRPDSQWIVVGFGTPEIAALLTGGVLAAIGWVMVEAKRLADYNTQIV